MALSRFGGQQPDVVRWQQSDAECQRNGNSACEIWNDATRHRDLSCKDVNEVEIAVHEPRDGWGEGTLLLCWCSVNRQVLTNFADPY